MKKLLMLLAVTFAVTFSYSQNSVTKSENAQKVSQSCEPGCEKACCSKSKKKSCSKAEKKSCSKAEKKSCSKAEKKSCSGAKTKKSCAKSCGGSTAAYNKLVSPKDFVKYMDRFPAEQVVDIRTKAEVHQNGIIEGAKNIDFKASYFKEEMLKLDKNKAVMVYCRSGNRSGKAVTMLKSWGFTKIYDMKGGYNAYVKDVKTK